jgi:outer membrane protein OmpA-like peptidoglycan-associated protein
MLLENSQSVGRFKTKVLPSLATLLLPFFLLNCSTNCKTGSSCPFYSKSKEDNGYDKTLGGAVLGSGWGAGTGAIIGNQISATGEGLAVGAALGALSGGLTGVGYDQVEARQAKLNDELKSLRSHNDANTALITRLNETLDYPSQVRMNRKQIYQLYFDPDVTSLRSGSSAELQLIAKVITDDPLLRSVLIRGHSDDAGTPEYNERLSESRARSVASILGNHGVPMNLIKIESLGSKNPLVTNSSPEGRQLNRRVEIILNP